MNARILILDGVATNRIVLKVKMLAAQFDVDACENRADAESAISAARPDLILLNLTDPAGDHHAFCKALRNDPDTAAISIIAIGLPDTAKARFAALDAGADDVMSRPMNNALLLARIRNMLRVHSTGQEMELRESTSRALGFEETRSQFETPAVISFVTSGLHTHQPFVDALMQQMPCRVGVIGMDAVLSAGRATQAPDLLVINATSAQPEKQVLFGLVSDLRARIDTRRTAQLVVTPDNQPEVAALFLDLGADDVVPATVAPEELALRAARLVKRKRQTAALRATVQHGLHAALTDPLTGLYNRRYLDPHLENMSQQAAKSGRAFAIMMLDIDLFKAVNDTFGHAAGDMVLVQLADRLRENMRAIDLVARVGGEEFLIAMPRTSVRQARLAADRLRRMVNNSPFEIGPKKKAIRVTVSVGVAVSNQDVAQPCQITQVCEGADKALYQAKIAGRNQVAMSKSVA
jgi:two-component system cell cycle response regulator